MKHNPFYLVSAALMLVGCYLLSGAESKDTQGLANTLPVLAWLTAYEAALIGLGGFLARRGLLRDGSTLLVLAAVFMADFTNLSAETIAWSRHWTVATAGLLLLAAGKVAFACAAYGVRPPLRALSLAVAPLSLIYLLPAVCAAARARGLSLELPLYLTSWVLGGLMLHMTFHTRRPYASGEPSPLDRFMATLQLVLPASFAAHVFALHWQYDVPFYPCAFAAPLLAFSLKATRRAEAGEDIGRRMILPVAAVFLAAAFPASFVVGTPIAFSPLRLTWLLAAALYIYDFRLHRQVLALPMATGFGALAILGPTYGTSVANAVHLVSTPTEQAVRLIPRTRWGWGALLVAGAWVLLGIGAWSSVRRAGSHAGTSEPTR
jgi:hypothetical protein